VNYFIGKGLHRSSVVFFIDLLKKRVYDTLQEVEEKDHSDIFWDDADEQSLPLAGSFYQKLQDEKDLHWQNVLSDKCRIEDKTGRTDHAATVFYMVNCLQEFQPDSTDLDKFGRFRFEASYQSAHENIEEDLVGKMLLDFSLQNGLKPREKDTKIFISHDIDTIRGGLLQDGYWALRNFRIKSLFAILLQELLLRPSWKNMDRILRIQSEYDLKSTFFWLLEAGKDDLGIPQADYSAKDVASNQLIIDSKEGFENGLHKSTLKKSISEELEKAPESWVLNRYHFLKFNPYPDWIAVSESPIRLDASLGFSEHFGFRNSFGEAFVPFDFRSCNYFDFVEVPLTVMDMTFKNYLKSPVENTAQMIIEFIEGHSRNCVISLLWHNTFFTDYKFGDYLNVYKEIAKYVYEKKLITVTGSELLKEYGRN